MKAPLLAASIALCTACASSSNEPPISDASTTDSVTISDATRVLDTGKYGPPTGAPLDAGDLPEIACAGPDPCALPPSTCANANYVVYYLGGECIGGHCSFEKRFRLCPAGCASGGCRPESTAF